MSDDIKARVERARELDKKATVLIRLTPKKL